MTATAMQSGRVRLLFIDFTIQNLFVDADYPVGGWAVELRAWLQGLRAMGAETAILTTEGAPDAAERLGETRLLRVYARRGRIPGTAYLFRFLPRLWVAARFFGPDYVIQAVAGINTGLMCILARVLGRPFVYRCANDIDVDERFRQRLGRFAARVFAWGFAHADGYLAQNRYQEDAIRRRFPGKPVMLIHNPYQARAVEITPRATRGYVAWLGVFQPQKNLPLLADLAAALPEVMFRVAGKLEVVMNDPATHAALARLKSMPNVTLVGYLKRTEVPAFLGGALMLVSTSHYEGFSNTFLEAWGAGTPMVAPARIDPDGLIQSEGLGTTVSDDAALADAVAQIIALSESDYAALSARCRAHATTAHAPEALAARLLAFLATEVSA